MVCVCGGEREGRGKGQQKGREGRREGKDYIKLLLKSRSALSPQSQVCWTYSPARFQGPSPCLVGVVAHAVLHVETEREKE